MFTHPDTAHHKPFRDYRGAPRHRSRDHEHHSAAQRGEAVTAAQNQGLQARQCRGTNRERHHHRDQPAGLDGAAHHFQPQWRIVGQCEIGLIGVAAKANRRATQP